MFFPNVYQYLILGLALVIVPQSVAQIPDPDRVLKGTITGADHESYIELPFEVPAGTDRITVEFDYERGDKTTIDLGLIDPQRMRGWSGGNKSRFTLAETDATPSYLPGPLPEGQWRLLLGVPNIRQEVSSDYEAKIYFERGRDAFSQPFAEGPLRSEAGWYRGDLHTHTGHSDGSCDSLSGDRRPCALFNTAMAAEKRGLDFVAITDHNSRSHHQPMRELQPHFDRLLMIPGREITTFYGHANLFGTTGFVDFRLTGGNADSVLQRASELDAVVAINHPGLPSDERCMGCGWTADADFSKVHLVEVVNGGVMRSTGGKVHNPASGIPFWETRLNEGFRLTAVAGSDNHDAGLDKHEHSAVGRPTTVVYADSLSQPALLEGLKQGRVFIDVEGSRDRLLEMHASIGKNQVQMGQTLPVSAGDVVEVEVRASELAGAKIHLYYGGELASVHRQSSEGGMSTSVYRIEAKSGDSWFRAELVDSSGEPLLLGNPIYLRASPP